MITISPYIKNSILRKYFNLVLPRETISRQNSYNFKCQICGDGKSKHKKRGYLLLFKDKWIYKCHNCSISMLAEKWLKEYFPILYRQYIIDLIKNDESKPDDKEVRCSFIKKEEVYNEEKEVKTFVPILKEKTQLFIDAIDFCISRKIPENVWKRWFVSVSGKYKNRIIIPFYDDKNKIYFYQARALRNQEPKYLCRLGEKEFYNIYNVDKNSPIQVTEGPVDSLFLSNSIAILGCSLSNENFYKIKQLGKIFWLFDFDDAGLKASNEYITRGESVFLWKKYAKEVGLPEREKFDINDLMIFFNRERPFTFDELKNFYSSSIYDKIWL